MSGGTALAGPAQHWEAERQTPESAFCNQNVVAGNTPLEIFQFMEIKLVRWAKYYNVIVIVIFPV